jgi:hypothetical protein
MKKETLKSVKEAYAKYKAGAQAFMHKLQNPARRALLTVDAADTQRNLNGMTIVELITIVKLTAATGERVFFTASGKTITAWAEAKAPCEPWELL